MSRQDEAEKRASSTLSKRRPKAEPGFTSAPACGLGDVRWMRAFRHPGL